MKNCLDYEKLRHILEKAEKWETLDNNEKKYLDIIKALKEEKNKNIDISSDFQNNLKEDLLLKYEALYKKKWLYYKIMSMMEFPLLRFAVSFCFIFSITLWVYNGIYFNYENNMNVWWGIKFDSRSINSESLPAKDDADKVSPITPSVKELKKAESPSLKSVQDIQMDSSSISNSESVQLGTQPKWWWIQFEWSSNMFVSNAVKWSSQEDFKFGLVELIERKISVILILLFSLIISLIYTFIRKKK